MVKLKYVTHEHTTNSYGKEKMCIVEMDFKTGAKKTIYTRIMGTPWNANEFKYFQELLFC